MSIQLYMTVIFRWIHPVYVHHSDILHPWLSTHEIQEWIFPLQGPYHNDVSKGKHFRRYWPFVRGIHRSPVTSPQVTGEFPAQRPVTRSFYVSFDLRLNIRLSKQSWGWWFEMPFFRLKWLTLLTYYKWMIHHNHVLTRPHTYSQLSQDRS